jgi:hypothetical protein
MLAQLSVVGTLDHAASTPTALISQISYNWLRNLP